MTAPASPNQNGKVERFHGTVRPDFLDTADAFTSISDAQAAVDAPPPSQSIASKAQRPRIATSVS
ncbi:integrase core domain-containing protein [Micromonospora sp. NBC_00617]|uniref:integrase core domain-containing protein n=1 Tax=Micromonospora sp. NBC_00617 TaxID=2903587 RepID=UPI003866259C